MSHLGWEVRLKLKEIHLTSNMKEKTVDKMTTEPLLWQKYIKTHQLFLCVSVHLSTGFIDRELIGWHFFTFLGSYWVNHHTLNPTAHRRISKKRTEGQKNTGKMIKNVRFSQWQIDFVYFTSWYWKRSEHYVSFWGWMLLNVRNKN